MGERRFAGDVQVNASGKTVPLLGGLQVTSCLDEGLLTEKSCLSPQLVSVNFFQDAFQKPSVPT